MPKWKRVHVGFNRSKFLMWTVLAALTACAAVAILMILGGFGDSGGNVLGTLLLIAMYSLTALGCNWVLDRGVWRWAMVAGLVASGVGLGVMLLLVWVDLALYRHRTGVIGSSAVIPAVTLPVLGLLALTKFQEPLLARVRVVGLAVLAVFAALVWGHFLFDTDVHAKLTGVMGVLSGLVVVGLPVAQRLYGVSAETAEMESARPEVFLRCPRCEFEQTLRVGRRECVKCGLRIEIRLEEPRCVSCGYLLYKLAGGRCPECGREVTTG